MIKTSHAWLQERSTWRRNCRPRTRRGCRPLITFSGKREPIKIGLLKAMLRKAGLSEAEFARLLEGGR
jgi:hypothetical protein